MAVFIEMKIINMKRLRIGAEHMSNAFIRPGFRIKTVHGIGLDSK